MARFSHGNRAAVGNRGGGRPPRLIRALTTDDAPKIWDELKRIAFDVQHPLHAHRAFDAIKVMAAVTFPRPQTVVVEASEGTAAESLTMLRLAEIAAHRLDTRARDIQEHGVCDACAGSGIGRSGFGVRGLPGANGGEKALG